MMMLFAMLLAIAVIFRIIDWKQWFATIITGALLAPFFPLLAVGLRDAIGLLFGLLPWWMQIPLVCLGALKGLALVLRHFLGRAAADHAVGTLAAECIKVLFLMVAWPVRWLHRHLSKSSP